MKNDIMANMLQLTDNRNVPVVGSCDAAISSIDFAIF